MKSDIELQHLNVKLFLDPSPDLDLWEIVPVFHHWIQDQIWGELLVDVADYRHVPGGPGIVLIGHEADYSVDNCDNRLGVRYNRKTVVHGTNQERLSQALGAALKACARLETDQLLRGQFRFGRREIKISVNDRLLIPNVESSYESTELEIKTFFTNLLDGLDFAIRREDNPRNPFGLTITTAQECEVDTLLEQLNVPAS